MTSIDTQIGKVTHYYDKIGVAVIETMNHVLTQGTKVKFSGHDQEFDQTISSIEVEHQKVSKVSPGKSAGVKVEKPVRKGDTVYLLTE